MLGSDELTEAQLSGRVKWVFDQFMPGRLHPRHIGRTTKIKVYAPDYDNYVVGALEEFDDFGVTIAGQDYPYRDTASASGIEWIRVYRRVIEENPASVRLVEGAE